VCPAVPGAEQRVALVHPAACKDQPKDASCESHLETRTFKGSIQVKLCHLTNEAKPKCKPLRTTPAWTSCEAGAAAIAEDDAVQIDEEENETDNTDAV